MYTLTTTKTIYTIQELKKYRPDAFTKAIEHLRPLQWEDNYTLSEIVSSLKKLINSTNYSIENWSIGENNSRIKLSRENTDDFTGRRAFAWLENDLLVQFRIPYTLNKAYLKYNQAFTDKALRPYSPGKVKPCPLTGMCYDEDLITSLISSIHSGMTVRDSLLALADTAQELICKDIEFRSSEDYLIDEAWSNGIEFDEDGGII
jgi:hypothetical protein